MMLNPCFNASDDADERKTIQVMHSKCQYSGKMACAVSAAGPVIYGSNVDCLTPVGVALTW